MFKFDKIIYKIMKDNKLGSYLFTVLAFASALLYIHGQQIKHQVGQAEVLKETTEAMHKAIEATGICQDDLARMRERLSSVEVELAVMKEKGR